MDGAAERDFGSAWCKIVGSLRVRLEYFGDDDLHRADRDKVRNVRVLHNVGILAMFGEIVVRVCDV